MTRITKYVILGIACMLAPASAMAAGTDLDTAGKQFARAGGRQTSHHGVRQAIHQGGRQAIQQGGLKTAQPGSSRPLKPIHLKPQVAQLAPIAPPATSIAAPSPIAPPKTSIAAQSGPSIPAKQPTTTTLTTTPAGTPVAQPSPGASSGSSTATDQPAGNVDLKGPLTQTLTISAAMNETLAKSPRAEAVRLQLGITKSQLVRATELPNPTIFMDNGYKAEFTYRYGVVTPVEMPWKLAFRILAAKRQIKQVDFEIRNALWRLRGDIRRAYTELVVAQETYETLVDLADLSARLLEVAQKRFQAGDVPELDVLKARLAANQNNVDRDVGARRVVLARQQLAVILGRAVDTPVEVPRLSPFKLQAEVIDLLPDFARPLPPLSDLLGVAIDNRLELKALKQAIKTNQANLKVAIGNILPNPSIGAGSSVVNGPAIDFTQLSPGDPPPRNGFHGYFIQLYQELPIFNFQQGDISQYRNTIKQLRGQVLAQQNIITQEVSGAYQKLLAARQKLQTYQEKLLADSAEVARLSRRSYEVGQSDITSTLLTQQANIQVRYQYLDAVNAYQQAFTDLEQSIGTTLQ